MQSNIYRRYLENLQQPAGWFELVVAMTKLMAVNARNNEDLSFLFESGCKVAESFALPAQETLAQMTSAMNSRLDDFKWGYVEIKDLGDSLQVHHFCMPTFDNKAENDRWLRSFCAVLCGLYETWFHQCGASSRLHCLLEKAIPPGEAIFTLKRSLNV
ncbi:MAG: hypothetical protein J6M93_04110 [Succinivibrio sp.]|nr:hypothetical protein [Succinivibrio sp.]